MIFDKVNKKQHMKRGLLLGMVLGMVAQSMATTLTNDGATGTGTTTHQATIDKTVQVLGFAVGANGDADSSKDFSVTFADEDILELARYRTLGGNYAADLSDSYTDIWVPIASTEVCVVSNNAPSDDTNMLQAGATITALTDSNSNTLKTAVAVKGNGNVTADGAVQNIFVCGSSCQTTNKFLSESIIPNAESDGAQSGSTMGTLSSTYDNSVSTKVWGMGSVPGASVASGTPSKFDHTNILTNSNNYGLAYSSSTVDTSSTEYRLDKTSFNDNQCGTDNANAVRVIVFASLEDIISNPAATYTGRVQLDFNRAATQAVVPGG